MRNLEIREMKSSTFVCLILSPQYEKQTGSAGEEVGLLGPRPFPPSGCSLLPVVFNFSFVLTMKPCFPQSVERLFPES